MMDPAKTTLGRMLLDQITPAVMVLRTPLVDESCRRNGLSFIEMLKPFCNFNKIDVSVRTASDQPYRLRRFKLRLFYASEIRQPNIEANIEESLWQSLEEDIIPSLSVMRTNWLESQPKVIPKIFKESNVCVSGESIKVDVNFRNPLQIPLSISNISLVFEYSAESNET